MPQSSFQVFGGARGGSLTPAMVRGGEGAASASSRKSLSCVTAGRGPRSTPCAHSGEHLVPGLSLEPTSAAGGLFLAPDDSCHN